LENRGGSPAGLKVDLTPARRASFRRACADSNEEPLANLIDRLSENLGPGPYTDFNGFLEKVEADADRHGVKLTAKRVKLLQTALAEKDESAAPVIKKLHRPGKIEPDPLRGLFCVETEGRASVVEYELDADLRDTEQIPLLEPGGIDAFFQREVLPYVPDAWIDESSTRIGYEISFTRYFYKPQPLRTLEEIRADIEALEKETEGLLRNIIG